MSYTIDGGRGSITVAPAVLAALVVSVDGADVRRGRCHLDVEIREAVE